MIKVVIRSHTRRLVKPPPNMHLSLRMHITVSTNKYLTVILTVTLTKTLAHAYIYIHTYMQCSFMT